MVVQSKDSDLVGVAGVEELDLALTRAFLGVEGGLLLVFAERFLVGLDVTIADS